MLCKYGFVSKVAFKVVLNILWVFATKGQLIWKHIFGTFKSPKIRTEKNWLYYYGTSSQIVVFCFLGQLKTPKRHFEIKWPLEFLQGTKLKISSMNLLLAVQSDSFFQNPIVRLVCQQQIHGVQIEFWKLERSLRNHTKVFLWHPSKAHLAAFDRHLN